MVVLSRQRSSLTLVTFLMLSSCRLAGSPAATGIDPNAMASLNAIAAGPMLQDRMSNRLTVLRYANRLPSVPFPSTPSGCLPQGESFGDWIVRFDGYGCVNTFRRGGVNRMSMGPKIVEKNFHTHAPMVLGPQFAGPLMFHARVETTAQLRPGNPNPWEVAWLIWNYTDDQRFYYFIPKPNGWELGKRDPAYPGGQRFLASGSDKTFPIGRAYDVTIVQSADHVTIFVDGETIVQATDQERPYREGRIGIYSEDALVNVYAVRAI